MSKLFFTSDTHFSHAKIIEYCNRPFTTADEMDEVLVANWNARVSPSDQIWHLGDFAFSDPTKTNDILKRLNGHKHFIKGNHDKVFRKNEWLFNHFETVADYKEIKWNSQKIVLTHYPLLTWNGAHHGSWSLSGHCHSSCNWYHDQTTSYDVGVDNNNYVPISFEEVQTLMLNKTYKKVDHHG